MELWFIIIVTICIVAFVKSTLSLFSRRKNPPPGPPGLPLIGNMIWLRKSAAELAQMLYRLKTQYGPLLLIRIWTVPFVFIGSHSLAHRALVQNGAAFADRPDPLPTVRTVNPTMMSITVSPYGPTWRHLRRNLAREILSVRRARAYSESRRWVLSILLNRLASGAESTPFIDHFQHAMYCLLVCMCIGDRLPEYQINEIKETQRGIVLGVQRYSWLNLWPRLTRLLFRQQWNELIRLRDNNRRVMIPLIRARIQAKESGSTNGVGQDQILAYVDTLANLQLPEENRKLREDEIAALCNEFLVAGTDSTTNAMQWIMANMVKYPEYQEKVYQEIIGVIGTAPPFRAGDTIMEKVVEEGDLEKMSYLKAVVLEGLRRHPPGHLGLPRKMKEDVELDGYTIPKNAIVSYMMAGLSWDPKVWDDPMEFNPNRFFTGNGTAFDLTGSREIKMMPFGMGRRICPAVTMSLMHLEYFVANLIWYFEWSAIDGEEIDLTEKVGINIAMKNPLRARISPRA